MTSRLITCAIFIAISLPGCGLVDADGPDDGTGKIQIRMLGGSLSYDEVNVVIDSLTVHRVVDDTSEGWTTLVNTSETYDLLTLVNGAEALLADQEIEPGRYSQMRLHIGEGSNVVVNGKRRALTTPSGRSSGVKLNIHAEIEPGKMYRLRLRFNPHRSIVVAGNPRNPKFSLKPVIEVVPVEANSAIKGTLVPDTVSATVWAFGTLDTVSTSPDIDGKFLLPYLVSDVYTVSVAPNFTYFADTLISGIPVSGADTVDIGSVVLAEN